MHCMTESRIQRRVDFFGIPVKKTTCEVGQSETLYSAFKCARVTIRGNDHVKVERGYCMSRTGDLIADASGRRYYLFEPELTRRCQGKEIKRFAKGPRRLYGKRVSFRLADTEVPDEPSNTEYIQITNKPFNVKEEEERLSDLGSRISAAATRHGVDLSKIRSQQATSNKPASK